jgi:hypothetical protein
MNNIRCDADVDAELGFCLLSTSDTYDSVPSTSAATRIAITLDESSSTAARLDMAMLRGTTAKTGNKIQMKITRLN